MYDHKYIEIAACVYTPICVLKYAKEQIPH